MILRFYSLCRGIGVVPFVPSWSVAVASVGPGLGGETDMTGATGFLDVAEDSRSPAEYGERTTAMCAALHVFAFFFAFWRLVQRSHPQEIQLNLTAPQGVLNVKRFVPGLNSRLKSNRQIPSLAACSSLSGWIKRCVNAVNGFVFLMAFGWFWAFNVSMALSFSLHFQTWSWIPLQGLAHLSMMTATRWHAITLKCAWHVEALHSFWLSWNVGRKVDADSRRTQIETQRTLFEDAAKQCGDSWFGQSCDHFARRGFMTISQFHRIPSVFNAGSSVAAFGWKLRLVPVELGLAPVRRESWTDRSQLMSI